MVRAEVVNHTGDWHEFGHSELLVKRQRYKILDTNTLMELPGIDGQELLIKQRKEWIEQTLDPGLGDDTKDPRWTGGIAVGLTGLLSLFSWFLGIVRVDDRLWDTMVIVFCGKIVLNTAFH